MDRPFVRVFSKLEQHFDEITDDRVWCTSKPRQELSFLTDVNEHCVEITLQVKGVENYVWKYGKKHNRMQPDFVVLDDEELKYVQDKLRLAAEVGEWENPFHKMRPKNKIAVEILGSYTHAESTIGVSKEEHERQLYTTYGSIGWKVYLIWEDQLERDELPADLFSYLCKNSSFTSSYEPRTPRFHVFYLQDPTKFRAEKLSEERKKEVVSEVVKSLRALDEPLLPFLLESKRDALELLSSVKDRSGGHKTSLWMGQKTCWRFVPNVFRARLKTYPSLWEMWHDDKQLSEAVNRKLELFEGAQTVSKFKYELLHGQNYRSPSNFPPLTAAMVYTELGLKKSDRVFDPCAGFGGRLMGAWAVGVDYVAVEASKSTVEQLSELSCFLNSISKNHETVIIHGAVEDIAVREQVLKLGKFDAAFTSPPYFNYEHYSEDAEQSDVRYVTWEEWKDEFLEGMLDTVREVLKDKSKLVLNVPKRLNDVNFASEVKHVTVMRKWSYDHEIRLVTKVKRGGFEEEFVVFKKNEAALSTPPGFGVKHALKNYYMPEFQEGVHYVTCKLCGERHARLSQHLRRIHRLSRHDYVIQFPGSQAQAQIDKERVVAENQAKPKKGTYAQRIAYRLPDGSVVRRKDAWLRAWSKAGQAEPPPESRLRADDVADELLRKTNKFDDSTEGTDFVVCEVCGYKGKRLARHVRREHGDEVLAAYTGRLTCDDADRNQSGGAFKAWTTRRTVLGGTGYKR